MFDGYGTFAWGSGRQIYEGFWLKGQINGKGKMTLDSGHVYIGEFANGVREGAGVLELKGKRIIEGTWVNDKLQDHKTIEEPKEKS